MKTQIQSQVKTQKLLLVDAGVPAAETLLVDMRPGYQIVQLTADSDAVSQITDALTEHAPVSELTLLSHGQPGQLEFANHPLDLAALNKRESELTEWRNMLTDNATIAIYACQLAAGKIGQTFIERLGELTGAKIAASSQVIGKVEGGSNWFLDCFTKPFEVLMPFGLFATEKYQYSLAPILSVAGVSIEEASTGFDPNFLEFEVSLTEPSTGNISVKWLSRPGTTDELDFSRESFESGTLTIPAGDTTGFISLRLNGDSSFEVDESVQLELYNPNGAEFADGADRLKATGIILDDDSGTALTRALFVSDAEVIEGDSGTKSAVFSVKLSRPASTDLSFDYQTVNGSAQAGSDFAAVSGTLTFLAGQTEASVSVDVTGDTLIEGSENFTMLVRPQAGSASAIANGVDGVAGEGRIIEDDNAVNAQPVISIRDVTINEASTGFDVNYLSFAVTLSEPSTGNISVKWLSRPGTTDELDFSRESFESGTLTIPAGDTTGFISLRLNGDSSFEADESVQLELYNPNGAEFADGADRLKATGIILDDDSGTALTRALFVSDAEVIEGDSGTKSAVFSVKLSRPASTDLSFDYQTVNGSAQAGSDFTAVSGTLTFLAGQTEASVSVDVTGDTLIEGSENFTMLVRPQAGSASAIANGVDGVAGEGRIIEDDNAVNAQPVISIRDVTINEASTGFDVNYLSFAVTLSEPSTNTVTVDWDSQPGTVSANDFSQERFGSGTLTIPAGDTTGFISLRLNGDSEFEIDESVLLEISNPVGATFSGHVNKLQATGIIQDDEGTQNKLGLFVAEETQIVEGAPNNTRDVVVPVQLSRPSDQTLTFQYQTIGGSAVAGQDFTAQNGSVTFEPGQTQAAVIIPITGDSLGETPESFTLSLTPTAEIANGVDAATGTITIIDGNLPPPPGELPTLTVNSVSVTEGPGQTATFTIQSSAVSTETITGSFELIGNTATAGSDFQADFGTFTILPGGTGGPVVVDILDDTISEETETFQLRLFDVNNAVLAGGGDELLATGQIIDNEPPPTPGDAVIVQRGVVSSAAGNDTYVLSSSVVDSNARITISDNQGTNEIQLFGGLGVTNSIIASDTTRLDLSNGAQITILGASSFNYEISGDPLAGIPGTINNYTNFVVNILGSSIPQTGTNSGDAITINEDGTVTPGADPTGGGTGDPNDDIFIVQRGVVSKVAGDDTYILSSSTVDSNAEITISDSQGANTLQLFEGLSIASSIVASDTALLTLANGAEITLLGASSFTYETGGNPLAGTSGQTNGYTNFVTGILGTTVPNTGEAPANGGAVIINADGSASTASENQRSFLRTQDNQIQEGDIELIQAPTAPDLMLG
ncbi:Calx-beta domain-containing protein [Nitrosomonas marina]|uniref:Calx-beta domain-containing protein n=1 Tax=Nitrosomonas marina TaxID=917 RepID=A0A1I0CSC6_9PROT|nr:Calx-beta domain-containing protein [Nitrosomonas marina]SET22702.1 Calx-beta domain-containing protein [Nitrosomonas marina]